MKRVLLLLIFAGAFTIAGAQTLPDLSGIKLEKAADVNKKADDAALKVAVYLQSVKLDKTSSQHQAAYVYLTKWIKHSPTYLINTRVVPGITDGNNDLTIVMLAAMTEFVLTHQNQKNDLVKQSLYATQKAIAYAKVRANKVRVTGEFINAMEAEKRGKLEQYVRNRNK